MKRIATTLVGTELQREQRVLAPRNVGVDMDFILRLGQMSEAFAAHWPEIDLKKSWLVKGNYFQIYICILLPEASQPNAQSNIRWGRALWPCKPACLVFRPGSSHAIRCAAPSVPKRHRWCWSGTELQCHVPRFRTEHCRMCPRKGICPDEIAGKWRLKIFFNYNFNKIFLVDHKVIE